MLILHTHNWMSGSNDRIGTNSGSIIESEVFQCHIGISALHYAKIGTSKCPDSNSQPVRCMGAYESPT